MSRSPRFWNGDDWEEYCLQLLYCRHGATEVERVPSDHKGDLGIEAFSRDGCAYQCYAPEEPLATSERYEKQRDKLTVDLGKLNANAAELAAMLGAVRIRRYVFMVPLFDHRQLLSHASRKAEELRRLTLPMLTSDFEIQVVTDEAFPLERAELAARAVQTIRLNAPAAIDEATIGAWATQNDPLVRTLDKKLSHITRLKDANKRSNYARLLLENFIEGEDYLQQLRQSFPTTWSKFRRAKASYERFLKSSSPVTTAAPADHLASTLSRFEQEVTLQAPEVDSVDARQLSLASVADWLLRCPLSFD